MIDRTFLHDFSKKKFPWPKYSVREMFLYGFASGGMQPTQQPHLSQQTCSSKASYEFYTHQNFARKGAGLNLRNANGILVINPLIAH